MEEICINCGDVTGKAGFGEDSLYLTWECDGAVTGPYCEDCHDAAVKGRLNN